MKIKVSIRKSKEKPMNIDMSEHAKTHSVPKVMRRDYKPGK